VQLEIDPGSKDRMGLRRATKDPDALPTEKAINRATIMKLQSLVREYGKREQEP